MKTAVVTGAGRGLGRLIARGLADKRFSVLVTDIDEVAAADTARHIVAAGGDAWSMHQDVRDPDSHRAAARAASDRGDLSVWVNNAGVLKAGDAWELSDDEIRREIEINVLGVMWGARAALACMDRGHIINIASISSIVPAPGVAVYAASKHAVLGFSLSLAGDLDRAGRPIRVSALCPDAMDTDMVRSNADNAGSDILFSAGKLLSPERIAQRAVDLVDRPRLISVHPRRRGLLIHIFRPFPAISLKLLGQFRKRGARNRQRR